MDKGLTLDQVLYAALKNDLVENRHTDAVLSFFDEGAAKVVHSAGCHRIALTAKSSLFHNILVENQVEIEFNFFPKHKFFIIESIFLCYTSHIQGSVKTDKQE